MAKFFAALCIAGFALGASAAELRFDFSKTKLGETPPGFASFSTGGDPAKWSVVEEKVTPLLAPIETNSLESAAKREVLAVQSFDLGEKHSPVLIYTNEVLSDFVFTTRFKINGGIVEPSAGLIFRAQDQSNYYCVRASSQGYLLWYKVVNGQSYEGQGIGVKMTMPEDQWRELRIECNGSRMRCVLDGKLVLPPPREGSPTNNLAINDTTFTRGKIGFWSRADTKCFFVDANIQYTQRVPYIQVAINNMIKRHQPILGIKVYAR
ncbi:MAG TPA: family 16 glycoside hydrolase, partial [Verrucomicrobiae bacterium]|nr:family 16 glycoside hydrolase [Verrucomicrobiae bacterium]